MLFILVILNLFILSTKGSFIWEDFSGAYNIAMYQDDITSDTTGVTQAQCESNCAGDNYCAAYQHDADTDRCVLADSVNPGLGDSGFETMKLKRYESWEIHLNKICDNGLSVQSGMAGYDCFTTCRDDSNCFAYSYDEDQNRCLFSTGCTNLVNSNNKVTFIKPTSAPTLSPTVPPTPPTFAPTLPPTVYHTYVNDTGSCYDVNPDNVLGRPTVIDASECELECTLDTDCTTFQFNEDNNQCELFSRCHRAGINQGFEVVKIKSWDNWIISPGFICDGSHIEILSLVDAYYCFTQCKNNVNCQAYVQDYNGGKCVLYGNCDTVSASTSRITATKPTPAPTISPTFSPTMSPVQTGVTVGKVEVKLINTNPVASQTATNDAIADIKSSTTGTTIKVKTTEKATLPSSFYSSNSNKTQLQENIKAARGCTDCQVVFKNIPGGSRRMLQGGDVTVEIIFSLDDTAFAELVNTGNNLDDPQFLSDLATASGVPEGDISITVVGTEVVLEVTLVAYPDENGNPVTEDSIQDLQNLQDNVETIAQTVISEVGDGEIESQVLDLCGERDCSGRGTCNTETGICVCTGDWWGINCESTCECYNGGECVNSYCQCLFPYFGLRCDDIATLGPIYVPE